MKEDKALEEEIKRYQQEDYDRDTTIRDIARHFANWQKQQMENNRIAHCDTITEEEYNLETNFVDQHIDKYNRLPTYLDAIEYGKQLQKHESENKML